MKKGLEGIDYISVREQEGSKIVKDLTGRDVPVLVDPTLLLTSEEWEKVMERPVWYRDEKYKLKIVDLMDKENIDYYCPPRVNFCI